MTVFMSCLLTTEVCVKNSVQRFFSKKGPFDGPYFGGSDIVFAFPCCQGSGTRRVNPRRMD